MATLTSKDIQNGYKLECPLSWREIMTRSDLVPADVAELMDILHELIPNECDVHVTPQGQVAIDVWREGRRRDEILFWLEHCHYQGLITKREFEHVWNEIRRII